MRTTVLIVFLFASMQAASTAAAQPAPFNEAGVDVARISETATKNTSAKKRVSIDGLSPKHTSRPRISKAATKNASATKRVSIDGLSPMHTSRPRISETATKSASAIKRASIDSLSPKPTSQQHSSERSESVCVIKRVSIVGPSSEDIPLPEPELLNRQAAPDCEFKSAAQAADEVALRAMKLDYEQQCYRQSESILRARMERLQDAVRKTIESINRRDRAPSPGNEGSDRRGARASAAAGE
jgi:hypothetical protein